MKKVFAAAAAVLMCATVSYAQSFRDMFRSDDKGGIEWGVRAGLNISDIAGKYTGGGVSVKADLKSLAGFHVGGVVGIPVTNGFYVQPGLMFSSKGARDVYKDSGEGWSVREVTTMFPVYMEIPVLASFRADIVDNVKLNVNVGPYFGIGLGGNMRAKWKYEEDGQTESGKDEEPTPFFGKSDDNKVRGNMQRFDFGLSFGAGVALWEHYYVGIKYDLGLVNMAVKEINNNVKLHNGTFAITLGYNF